MTLIVQGHLRPNKQLPNQRLIQENRSYQNERGILENLIYFVLLWVISSSETDFNKTNQLLKKVILVHCSQV